MTSTTQSFAERLSVLQSDTVKQTLTGICHGVERETLRICPDGKLAQTAHPDALGSALTHDSITTDFSESLLEFITPPETDTQKTLSQLRDIHKYVSENIGEERLWPLSMPCYIDSEEQIPLARYGESNVGKMKTLYRRGLKNRYGSMMQAISGVHFNFSLPEVFWQQWLSRVEGQDADKHSVSAAYFAMIRNYRRLCWMIPYLFGASPAICGSFIRGKESAQPFEKLGTGTYYLPYATSLRMSDLGYTNSAQSGLAICYNKVDTYIASLRKAISTPSDHYARFAGKVDGEYQQLNSNVLQIENELYSPIRPKQPTRSLEKPTDALADRGVSYIEVRALDVDPFSDVGISPDHFYFLDVFLLYCLTAPSAFMDVDKYRETEENLMSVVTHGRDPQLRLSNEGESMSIPQWAESVFPGMSAIAEVLDSANGTTRFSEALANQLEKIRNPALTPSGKMLDHMLSLNEDNGVFGVKLAEQYKVNFEKTAYELFDEAHLKGQAKDSIHAQSTIEAEDDKDFDTFLQEYFEELQEAGQGMKSVG